MRLVLPGVRPHRAAAGVQVVDEQGRHERLGGGGLEDLDAEPGCAGVRRRQRPVLQHRSGAGRRGHVHRHAGTRIPGDRRTPAVHALGQRVVGSLLRDQAVADTRVGAGRVGLAHQPPAGGRPQRPAAELRGRGPGGVRAGGLGDRIGRDGEHVGRRGQERERDIAPRGRHAHGQRVDGGRQQDVGRAVGVDVVAQHQGTGHGGEPVGHGRDVLGQVQPGPLREIRVARGGRDKQRPRAAPRLGQHPLPDDRPREVYTHHPGAPAQQHRQRPHFGARPEHHDRLAGHGQPVGVRRDRPHRVRARWLDDAVAHPRVEPPLQGAPAQLLAVVRHRQLAFGRPGPRHRDRGQPGPRGRGDQCVEPGLLAVAADEPHPPVQRLQPFAGDRQRGLPRGQPRLDQPAEMHGVTPAPVLLPFRGAGPGGIDQAQRVHDDGPAQRRGAPAPVGRNREGHPGRLGAAHPAPAAITRPSSMRVPPHAPGSVRVKISFLIPNGPWCAPPGPAGAAGVTDVIPSRWHPALAPMPRR